jgi:hypothetical protein
MEQWNDGILGPLVFHLFEKAGKDATIAAALLRPG